MPQSHRTAHFEFDSPVLCFFVIVPHSTSPTTTILSRLHPVMSSALVFTRPRMSFSVKGSKVGQSFDGDISGFSKASPAAACRSIGPLHSGSLSVADFIFMSSLKNRITRRSSATFAATPLGPLLPALCVKSRTPAPGRSSRETLPRCDARRPRTASPLRPRPRRRRSTAG